MANVAYYCFHECKLLPHQFNELPLREKAFVIAMVQLKIEADKKEAKKYKSKGV